MLRGYHKLFTYRVLPIHRERTRWTQDSAPPYHLRHSVQPAPWSFLDLACDDTGENSPVAAKSVRFVDLSTPPPYHLPPEGFQVNHLFRNIYDTNLCNSFGIVTIPNYSFPLFANLELSH